VRPPGAATAVVTPEALVVATGPVRVGAWPVDVDEPVDEPASKLGVVDVTVPVVPTGMVLASAAVDAPTPTTSAASDQLDRRLTR